jgi:hypothetical protein
MTNPIPVVVMIYRRCKAVRIHVNPNGVYETDEITATLPDYAAECPHDLMNEVRWAVSRQINGWCPDLKDKDITIEPMIADDDEDVPEKAYEGMPQA